MRIIEQVSLIYRVSGSEKVHEVDLCEVGPNRYVVNFRYGRRGTVLKDGSRTVLPVGLPEARNLYQKEIASKLEKGYEVLTGVVPGGGAAVRPEPVSSAPPPPLSVVPPPTMALARHQALMERLSQGDNPVMPANPVQTREVRGTMRRLVRNRVRKPRPLNRVIERVGDLQLKEAESYLLQYLGRGDVKRDYLIVLAMGRLGNASVGERLMAILRPQSPPMLRRAVFEAMRALSDEETRAAMARDRILRLPANLQNLASGEDSSAFSRAFFAMKESEQVQWMEELYRIDLPSVRPALLQLLRTAPFRPPNFAPLRAIYKSAEYRRDAEVFGIFAWRFEKTPALFRIRRQGRGGLVAILAGGKRLRFERSTLGSIHTELAYSDRTRRYLRDRIWRKLRRMGLDESPEFVRMAAGVLLAFTDADAVAPRTITEWDAQTRRRLTIHFDAWAPYPCINQLLYRRSTRYFRPSRCRTWRCQSTWRPGNPVPSNREEAFPALWDRSIGALLHLLAESACGPVQAFAVKALRQNPSFTRLGVEEAVMLMGRPHSDTALLGLELAQRLYQPSAPDPLLLVAAASSPNAAVRRQGWAWIQQHPALLFGQVLLLAPLVLHADAETRRMAKLLLTHPDLSRDGALPLVMRLCAELMALTQPEERLSDGCDAILQILQRFQLQLPVPLVQDLLQHSSASVQRLAAEQVVARGEIPDGLMVSLLTSPHLLVRELGLRLVSRISDTELVQRPELVLGLCVSPSADVRASSALVLRRLCRLAPASGPALAQRITDALLTSQPEGVHSHLVRLLREELPSFLSKIPADRCLALLKSKRSVVQEAAGVILQHRRDLTGLEFPAVAALAHHDVLSVRQAVWPLFEANLLLLKSRLGEVLGVLDSPWEETREAAFRFFFHQLDPQELSVDVLVAMADSNRADVQAFAEQLLLRAFREEHALAYLQKLSEHPSVRIQGFAANYLETAAAGNVEVLRSLTPYFRGVLSRVNRGRVAKARIHAFLASEAQKSPEAAEVVSQILSRQVVSNSVEDKARSLATLVAIHREHPELSWPGRFVQAPLREA